MLIKTHTIVILATVVIIAMIAEWRYVAFTTEVHTTRRFHGLCNGGVGLPYADFVHQLRTLSESGDTNTLDRALRRADEHSRDIYDVWLTEEIAAYRDSLHEILK